MLKRWRESLRAVSRCGLVMALALLCSLPIDGQAPASSGDDTSALDPASVTEDQAELAEEAKTLLAEGDAQAALATLATWPQGEGESDHLVLALLQAQAHARLDQPRERLAALKRALTMQARDRQLWWVVGDLHRELEEMNEALAAYGQAWALSDSANAEPTLDDCRRYGWSAWRAGDLRLAALVVEAGLVRFPTDRELRRLDAFILRRSGNPGEAERALISLLNQDAGDTQAWRELSWLAEGEAQPSPRSLAMLEASALAQPDSLEAQARHLNAQARAGHYHHVVVAGERVLAEFGSEALRDHSGLAETLLYAALQGEDLTTSQALAEQLGGGSPSDRLRVLLAQVQARGEGPEQALQTLWPLVERGQADPSLLLWAADLARRADESAKQELALRAAVAAYGGLQGEDAAINAVVLDLANLMEQTQRRAQALDLLSARLLAKPGASRLRALRMELRPTPDTPDR